MSVDWVYLFSIESGPGDPFPISIRFRRASQIVSRLFQLPALVQLATFSNREPVYVHIKHSR
jgi:hypothetical protein